MKIISDFKTKDTEYINRLARVGDVILWGNIKYIRTPTGYTSELGFEIPPLTELYGKKIVVFKKGYGDYLEDLLTEAEKRCEYAYL